ncbi:MAG TPA: FAD-dependent oxidoreductase [Candidatus Eisenbacteria bacterium]|nr:FAD-dependent oxidoreductase [Candidatus Eisenbacteria bacterium]
MSLPTRAEVVIVGGGVIGASVAYHLTALGRRDVVVVDRAEGPGRGSTGFATGGFRAQYGTAINVRLSLLARRELLGFEETTGVDPGYVQAGYLWLASSEEALAALRDANRLQHAEGLHEAAIVAPGEIARINSGISLDGVVGGAFCPTDGFIRPLRVLEGYRTAAERAGARFVWGAEAVGIERDRRGRAVAVATCVGRVETDAVVNAAGPWAKSVAALAGVDLPVEPLRRQVVPTVTMSALPETMSMTIWADDGYHLRVRDGRALLLWPSPGAPGRPYDTSVDGAWIAEVEAMTRARVPALAGVAVDRAGAWAGLYEVSPDKHAILGAAPGCPNLWLVNGSSGHGVMHAPALGLLAAEMIVAGRAKTLEVDALRPERFAEGAAIEGPALL